MARVTFTAEGLHTLGEVQHFIDHAFAAGFPMRSVVDSPASGIGGGRLSVTTELNLLPLIEADADDDREEA